MKKYVLGFAFDESKNHILLIEKQKPEWQKGFLNGIGGKVEDSDRNVLDSMIREFYEEMWHRFAVMNFENDIMGGGAMVYCFRLFDDIIFTAKTMEIEKIVTLSMETESSKHNFVFGENIIKNLKVLIPMALDEDFNFSSLNLL